MRRRIETDALEEPNRADLSLSLSFLFFSVQSAEGPSWELLAPKSEPPRARTGHICVTYKDQIILFVSSPSFPPPLQLARLFRRVSNNEMTCSFSFSLSPQLYPHSYPSSPSSRPYHLPTLSLSASEEPTESSITTTLGPTTLSLESGNNSTASDTFPSLERVMLLLWLETSFTCLEEGT